jgi:hypothetical protein
MKIPIFEAFARDRNQQGRGGVNGSRGGRSCGVADEKNLRADLCGKLAAMQPWRKEIRKFGRNASGTLAKRGASA